MTVNAAANPSTVAPSCAAFNLIDTKLYVTVVTLSKKKWLKCRWQLTVQPQNNNLNYLIHPTFTNVNRFFFFFLSLERIAGENVTSKDQRDSF